MAFPSVYRRCPCTMCGSENFVTTESACSGDSIPVAASRCQIVPAKSAVKGAPILSRLASRAYGKQSALSPWLEGGYAKHTLFWMFRVPSGLGTVPAP